MHLLGLDKGDRRARFGSALSDDAIVAYTQGIDTTRGILIGASPLSGTRLIGAAEAQITGTRGRVEIAVSVHARLREQGLGTLLVNAVLHAAFGAGATAAEFVFSPENRPIVGLVRGLGARMYPTLDGAKIHSGNYRPGATLSATLTTTGTIWARDV